MNGSRFIVALDGEAPRPLELRRSELSLSVAERGTVRAGVWLEATEPGMTLDDRGADGWQFPVAVEVDFGDAGQPDARGGFVTKTRPATPPIDNDGFVFHGAHSMFTALEWRFEADGDGVYRVAVTCAATQHSVQAEAETWVRLLTLHRWGTEDADLFAKLVGPDWATFGRRDRPSGDIAWVQPREARAA